MYPTVKKQLPSLIADVEKILSRIENMYSAEIASDTQMRSAASSRAGKQVRNVLGQFGKAM